MGMREAVKFSMAFSAFQLMPDISVASLSDDIKTVYTFACVYIYIIFHLFLRVCRLSYWGRK